MHIVQLTAEFAPLAKAGGMGEVLVGLSRELVRMGHSVDVILPKYDFISLTGAQMEIPDLRCREKGQERSNTVWMKEVEDCPLHFIEEHHPDRYFKRGGIYGYEDDSARFIYFTLASLEYLKKKGKPIDVLHLHDWHTALAAPLVKGIFASQLKVGKVVLTIHNLEYQGKCASWDLEAIEFTEVGTSLRDNLHSETINLLKGGIIHSDAITTVSPTYAKEICTKEMGFGLDTTLREKKDKLTGILNGIDYKLWDPAKDPALAMHYDSTDPVKKVFSAKQATRDHLQKKFHLNPESRPWIGAVTRLVPQKGVELIKEALHETVRKGGTFLLLGTSPIPEIQAEFEELKHHYRNSDRVLLSYLYDDRLAHEIYAASDFLIIPSYFEPCGLSQLIALRYGTIPIVRATGGLKDTVFDFENSSIPSKLRNGIVFNEISLHAMDLALGRAFHLWKDDRPQLHGLIRHGMPIDCSWKRPASEYLRLYKK